MAGCKVIGIFGGVGSGKSLATEYLKTEYHAYVIHADDIAHRLYRKGQPGYKAVIRICKKSILDADGEIDRNKLANLLYSDRELIKKINAAIHPLVYKKTDEMILNYKKNHNNGLIAYEAAVISGIRAGFIDESWYIYTPKDERRKRLADTRGYSIKRIDEIMSNQPDDDEYREFCDKVIVNDGNIEKMEEQIDEIIKHSQWQQRKLHIYRIG
ncbi:MAG: dephospho-CoA kinase [Lachnospiraceae bacterium]|nr:dephospho-CoA kinase [Lachnospiraceae bacterium]